MATHTENKGLTAELYDLNIRFQSGWSADVAVFGLSACGEAGGCGPENFLRTVVVTAVVTRHFCLAFLKSSACIDLRDRKFVNASLDFCF